VIQNMWGEKYHIMILEGELRYLDVVPTVFVEPKASTLQRFVLVKISDKMRLECFHRQYQETNLP
jgi:hypothetical protein